jgi:uncharacterized protein YegL
MWLIDASGSMAADGKIQALNNSIREALPHLGDVARQNPFAQLMLRAIVFSTGAQWHVREPTSTEDLRWKDVVAGGYTDLGAALRLATAELMSPPMPERALPPALVLVSDGQPTDDWEPALESLMSIPWGARSIRLAVAIGRDVDLDVLERFIGHPEIEPVSASNPEQLVAMIRWASTVATRMASEVAAPSESFAVPIPQVGQTPTVLDEATW